MFNAYLIVSCYIIVSKHKSFGKKYRFSEHIYNCLNKVSIMCALALNNVDKYK